MAPWLWRFRVFHFLFLVGWLLFFFICLFVVVVFYLRLHAFHFNFPFHMLTSSWKRTNVFFAADRDTHHLPSAQLLCWAKRNNTGHSATPFCLQWMTCPELCIPFIHFKHFNDYRKYQMNTRWLWPVLKQFSCVQIVFCQVTMVCLLLDS